MEILTQKPTPLFTEHSLLLPMAVILGGKTQTVDLEIKFKTAKENLQLISIVGTISETEYNMDYLGSTHPQTLVDLIIGNKDKWNEDSIWYRSVDNSLSLVG